MKKIVLVQRFDIRKTRRDENFALLTLNLGRDENFESVNAKIWQADRFKSVNRAWPSVGQAIEVVYKEEQYDGAKQWVIENYRILEGAELSQANQQFVQPVRVDMDFYRRRVEELIEATDTGRVSGQILREVFDRASFRENFFKAPAAKSRHQNYPGGLLEHTINVTSVALALADAYAPLNRPGLNFNTETLPVDRTLLISAGLLHDIGKIETYRFAPLPETTDANSFEGHLPISYAIVRGLTERFRQSPPYKGAMDELDKLLNCILSHHGSLEFGSPVVPACVEAVLLAQADVVDARVATIVSDGNQALRRAQGARWLKSSDFAGGVFIGDWPAPPPIAQEPKRP